MSSTILIKLLAAFVIAAADVFLINLIRKRSLSLRIIPAMLAVMLLCAVIAGLVSEWIPVNPKIISSSETVVVTALGKKNSNSKNDAVYLTAVYANGEKQDLQSSAGPGWYWLNNWYIWKSKEDIDWSDVELSDRFELKIPSGSDRYLEFFTNQTKGIVRVAWFDGSQVIDCYSEKDGRIHADLPDSSVNIFTSYGRALLGIYALVFFILFSALWIALLLLTHVSSVPTDEGSHRPKKNRTPKRSRVCKEDMEREPNQEGKLGAIALILGVLILLLLIILVVFLQVFGRTSNMMANIVTRLVAVLLISSTVVVLAHPKKKKAFGTRVLPVALASVALCAAIAGWITDLIPVESLMPAESAEVVVITALGTKNNNAKKSELYMTAVSANGKSLDMTEAVGPGWYWQNKWYIWRSSDDPNRPAEELSDSFELRIPYGTDRYIEFYTNNTKGKVQISWGEKKQVIDCYSEENGRFRATLPDTAITLSTLYGRLLLGVFSLVFLVLFSVLWFVVLHLRIVDQDGPFSKEFIHNKIQTLKNSRFLFEELVKRDFKKKYKRSILGVLWSLLSPLMMLLVMRIVFTQFFGRTMPHYTTYLFCGNLVFSYFKESTSEGMSSLMGNAKIFTKVNIPKYLFLFSKNVQTLINFCLTLVIFFLFCVIDHITFTWKFIFLLFPIVMLLMFNIGAGLILSAMFVFFRDIQYLWTIFTQLLLYLSAIFYTIDKYSESVQNLFLLNPVYLFIRYFRKIVIEATIPSPVFHLLMLFDTALVLGIGCRMYMKYNTKFLYYV